MSKKNAFAVLSHSWTTVFNFRGDAMRRALTPDRGYGMNGTDLSGVNPEAVSCRGDAMRGPLTPGYGMNGTYYSGGVKYLTKETDVSGVNPGALSCRGDAMRRPLTRSNRMDFARLTAGVLLLTGLLAQPSIAASRGQIYDSAKHTRIYFHAGTEAFADEAVEYKVGKKKPPHLWESPGAALGAPNFKDHEGDRLANKPSFAALGGGGSITLRFTDNSLIDLPGGDLYIFEPLENSSPVKVEVSRDGVSWIDLGPDLFTRTEIDIAGKGGKNALFNFVRITDLSTIDPADQWPGADIDAVGALNSASKISVQDQSLCPEHNGKKKGATAGGEPKKVDIDPDLKRVADHYASSEPRKLVVEVYSDAHPEGKGDSSESKASSTSETKNAQAKKRSEAVHEHLTTVGKIPKDRIEIDFFDNARSMARREVEKEHERNNRFDFVLVPYDRDTVIADKGALKVEQASSLIDGKWESDQGEVILITQKDPAAKNIQVSGEWHESPAQKGMIMGGVYDPKTQKLNCSFVRTWSNLKGTVEFKLSYDSVRLNGHWKAENGTTGDWTLIRKKW